MLTGLFIDQLVRSIIMMFTMASVTAQSRPAFSIDRILGLELEKPGNCLTLHRPWTGEEQKRIHVLYKLNVLKSHVYTYSILY